MIDFGSSGSIVDAKCSQKDSSAGRIPAPVMNADIDQGVNTQIHTPVYPGKPDGIFGRIRIIHKGGGIFIAVGFHVGCPAFHIAGGGDQISDVRGIVSGKRNCLIKVAGKSFMCQCAEKFQRRGTSGIVDINYIGASGIHRRREVKSRT